MPMLICEYSATCDDLSFFFAIFRGFSVNIQLWGDGDDRYLQDVGKYADG